MIKFRAVEGSLTTFWLSSVRSFSVRTLPGTEIVNHYMITVWLNDRGTVGTEEQWAQRNSGHRGTAGTEEH